MKIYYFLFILLSITIIQDCFSQTDSVRVITDEEFELIYGDKNVITDGRGRIYRSLDLDIGGLYQINSFFYQLRVSKNISKHFFYRKRYGFNLEYSPWEKTLGANIFFEKNPFNKNLKLQTLIKAGGEIGFYTNFGDVNNFAFKPFISYNESLLTYQLKPTVFVSHDFKSVEYNIQFSLLIYLPIKELFFSYY